MHRNLPTSPTVGNGQSAVHFPMRSGDEVSLSFTTRDALAAALRRDSDGRLDLDVTAR